MKTITLIIRKFPEDVNRDMRVQAAMQGITLQNYVIKTLQSAVPKRGKQ